MSIWMEMECIDRFDPRHYLIAVSRTLRYSLNDSYRFHLTIDSYHVAAIIALNDRCLLFAIKFATLHITVYLLHEE